MEKFSGKEDSATVLSFLTIVGNLNLNTAGDSR